MGAGSRGRLCWYESDRYQERALLHARTVPSFICGLLRERTDLNERRDAIISVRFFWEY